MGLMTEVLAPPGTRWRPTITLHLAILAFLVFIAAVELVVRGPLGATAAGDLAAPYVSSMRFLRFENPYASRGFLAAWYAAGAPAGATEASNSHPMYPPTTLAVVCPLAYLRWPRAVALYTWLCAALYAGLIVCFARWIGGRWAAAERLGFIAFGLALAPIQTGIRVGNLSILAFLLCGYAVVLALEHWDVTAGILITLSLFVKPEVALPILLISLLSRRFRIVIASAGSAALLGLFTAAWMRQISPAWRQDYRHNIALLFSPASSASFTNPGSARFDLLNLQVPLFGITDSRAVSNLLALSIVAALCVVWLWRFYQNSRRQLRGSAEEAVGGPLSPASWLAGVGGKRANSDFLLIAIGAAGLLSLLPVYQRNYNAGFVLFALLWAFRHTGWRPARWIMIFSVPLLVPGEAILRRVVWPRLPHAVVQGMIWNTLIMPHLTWVVLVLACLSLWAMAEQSKVIRISHAQRVLQRV